MKITTWTFCETLREYFHFTSWLSYKRIELRASLQIILGIVISLFLNSSNVLVCVKECLFGFFVVSSMCLVCVRCEFGSKQPFLKRLFHVRKLIHMEKLQLKITTFREIFNCDMSLHVISNTNSALTPSAPNELQGCQLWVWFQTTVFGALIPSCVRKLIQVEGFSWNSLLARSLTATCRYTSLHVITRTTVTAPWRQTMMRCYPPDDAPDTPEGEPPKNDIADGTCNPIRVRRPLSLQK
jgi:hypothetical protein